MIKNLFIIPLFLLVSSPLKATVHEILVWDGYMQFLPSNLTAVQLGDTIEWHPTRYSNNGTHNNLNQHSTWGNSF